MRQFQNQNDSNNREPWPHLGGADIELGNFITGMDGAPSGAIAAQAILAEIDGIPSSAYSGSGYSRLDSYTSTEKAPRHDPQDWCRKYLATNGSSIYIDLGHTEIAFPELNSAREFVACFHAMLRVVNQARDTAGRYLPAGQELHVLANNTDGVDTWGSHLNFCIPRRTFDKILHEKVNYLLFLAGYQASSLLFTGQGKAGSGNGRPDVPFQISQRADFIESVAGWQTTYRRPIINLRDEPWCGNPASHSSRIGGRWARLHVIFYDSCLSHVSNYLKFGVIQLVLALIAQDKVDSRLLLDDPLAAVWEWSHDLTMSRALPLLSGGSITAIELQLRILEEARRMVEAGDCTIPDAKELCNLWEDTLLKLRAAGEDPDALDAVAPRLDWARKLLILRQALKTRPELNWHSPQIRQLDALWSSIDPQQGIYWAMERAGLVEKIVGEDEIERAIQEPPPDTRAYVRAELLRMAAPGQVRHVDWDSISFHVQTPSGLPAIRTLDLPDPFMGREEYQMLTRGCVTLDDVLDALAASAPVTAAETSVVPWYGAEY